MKFTAVTSCWLATVSIADWRSSHPDSGIERF